MAVEKNANNVDPETAAESQKAQQSAHEKELAEMQAMKDAANGTYTGVVADTIGETKLDSGPVGYSGTVDPFGEIGYGVAISTHHEYDTDGRETGKKDIRPDGNRIHIEFEYDTDGKRTGQKIIWPDGTASIIA